MSKEYNNSKTNIFSGSDLNKKERNNNIQNNNIQNNNIQNNNIQNDNIVKNKENDDNNIENKDKLKYNINSIIQEYKKLEGYLPFYLTSISCSIILKIFLDKIYIKEYNYNSRKNANYYLIISYIIFTYFSLIFYLLFWRYIIKIKEEKNKNKNKIKSKISCCEYFIYSETIPSKDICCYSCYNCGECCEDCKICCGTLNYGLCFNTCSCKQCWKCIFCCNCKECRLVKAPKTIKDINKLEKIYIIYRITGRWNYLASLITLPIIYPFTIFLYYVFITNFGFEERIWNNLKDNNNNENTFLINIYILLSIIAYYLINKFGGKISLNLLGINRIEKIFGEFYVINSGIIDYIIIQTWVSTILSALIYYKKIGKYENFILSMGIGSLEYIKIIILEYIPFSIETNIKDFDLFSLVFSVHLFIMKIILLVLNLLGAKNDSIIFFHFIFGITVGGLVFLNIVLYIVICLIFCIYKILKK